MSEKQATVSSRPGPSRKVVVQEDSLRVTEMTLPPGGEVRPHRHTWLTDVFYGLSGELLLDIEGREAFRLACGASAEVRPGLLHGARNVGAGEGRFLLVQHGGRYDFVEPSEDKEK
jgi:quercetin dioxygenase-like cupin family protein